MKFHNLVHTFHFHSQFLQVLIFFLISSHIFLYSFERQISSVLVLFLQLGFCFLLDHLLQIAILSIYFFFVLLSFHLKLLISLSTFSYSSLGVFHSGIVQALGQLVLLKVAHSQTLLKEFLTMAFFQSVHELFAGIESILVQLWMHDVNMREENRKDSLE